VESRLPRSMICAFSSEGIRLAQISTSMTINATASIMLAMYSVVASSQGSSISELRGTIRNDILKEYIARNTYIFPPSASLRLAVDHHRVLFQRRCANGIPSALVVTNIREAGANAVQSWRLRLQMPKHTSRRVFSAELQPMNLLPDYHSSSLSERFPRRNCKSFEQHAGMGRIMKEKFHAKKPESMMLRFHTQTSGETLTAQQPYNNVVRVALQALAAVLGGTPVRFTQIRLDEALSLPTEER